MSWLLGAAGSSALDVVPFLKTSCRISLVLVFALAADVVIDVRCCCFFSLTMFFRTIDLYFSSTLSIHATRTVLCGPFKKKIMMGSTPPTSLVLTRKTFIPGPKFLHRRSLSRFCCARRFRSVLPDQMPLPVSPDLRTDAPQDHS